LLRYIGCKTLLLDWIEEIITKIGITGGVFADLFTGTTTVAQHFKGLGYQIIASDIMYFSYAFQKTYITLNEYPSFNNLVETLNRNDFDVDIAQLSNRSISNLFINYLNDLSG